MKKRYLIIILSVLLLSAVLFCHKKNNQSLFFVNNPDGNPLALGFEDKFSYCDIGKFSLASITQWKDGFLGADYGFLYYYDNNKGKVEKIKNPSNYNSVKDIQKLRLDEKSVWNPTGLFYDNKNNLLYIANYIGHNVLVCDLFLNNDETITCNVIKEIKCEGMESPENIYSDNNGLIAVADYDGNSLFLFDRNGLVWKRDVPLAHGVCINNNCIYVTSLSERSIYKFNKKGKLIKKSGQIGFEGQNSYMWPTGLDKLGEKIIVTDAHTGRIVLLDSNLKFISSIGGLGPSNNMLNFPYCAVVIDNNLYIGDYYNRRVLVINPNCKISKIIGGYFTNIPDNVVVKSYEGLPYTYGVTNEIKSQLFHPFFNSPIILGYDSLFFLDGKGKNVQFNILDGKMNTNIFETSVPYLDQQYMVWVKKKIINNKEFCIIGGPQRSWQYCIYNCTDNIILFYSNNNLSPAWFVDGKWYGESDIEVSLTEIIMNLMPFYDKYLIDIKNGLSAREAYIHIFKDYYNKIYLRHLRTHMTDEVFGKWVNSFFTSDAGKKFLDTYICKSNKPDVVRAANEYYTSTQNGGTTICEMLFVKMFLSP